jgi:phthalate 4,5-dioxygenase reductase subunit
VAEPEIAVVIAAKTLLAESIWRFDLIPERLQALAPFTAGAHITVRTPNGSVRSYSLTDPPGRDDRYAITVNRDTTGRRASVDLIDQTKRGDRLAISPPRNTFQLVSSPTYLFIAGGIGITAIRSMALEVVKTAGAWGRFIYLTKTRANSAYRDDVLQLPPRLESLVHHSDTDGRLDLWQYLAEPNDTHLYCCGPTALMDDVRALTMHWRPSRVHFENFQGVNSLGMSSSPFSVVWQPTNQTIDVATAQTLLDALRSAGIPVKSSCESGTCGTCKLRLVSGEVDHRDMYLEEAERDSYLMPCVSRATNEALVVGPP